MFVRFPRLFSPRRASIGLTRLALVFALLLACGAGVAHAQGKAEDIPILDEPIAGAGAPAAPATPAKSGAKAAPQATSSAADAVPALTDEPVPAITDEPVPNVSGSSDASAQESTASDASSDDAAPVTSGGIFDIKSSFQPAFMRQALLAGVAVALLCSYLGVFVVLRRVAFVGVALAEASTAGIALAILLGFSPLLGGLGMMLVAVGVFSFHFAPRRLPNETAVGVVYVLAGALAILLLSKSAQGEGHLLSLLQGDVLTVEPAETFQMLFAFGLIAVAHLFFNRTWTLVSFDREAAATMGYSAGFWELGLLLTVGVAVAFASRAVGSLMTTGMLLLPAATALLWRDRLKQVFIVAPLLGLLAVVLGLHLSFVVDVPASAMSVTLAFGFFLIALLGRRLGAVRA